MTRQTVAAVVAHPDDEVLCCGATLARFADGGATVRVLILATGLAARGAVAPGQIETLRRDSESAARILGTAQVEFREFPDNGMDGVSRLEVVREVEEFLRSVNPGTVITHHPGDLNVDHGIVARAVMTAARPLPGSSIREVWAGEVPSSSEWGIPSERFLPQLYVDVTGSIDRKVLALEAYKDEIRPFPHPRSSETLRHLASLRGSEVGLPAAEAFVVLRSILR
jgi:LmbE family N-acetylglucosaminyl deacetylase